MTEPTASITTAVTAATEVSQAQNAKGLPWALKYGTVNNPPGADNIVDITLDGDTKLTQAISLIDTLNMSNGVRVAVIEVPPSGIYVLTTLLNTTQVQYKYIYEFGPSPSDTTTSGAMVTMKNGAGGNMSVNFTKRFSTTAIEISLHVNYFSTTADAGADFGVLINGVDYLIATMQLVSDTLSKTVHTSGIARVAVGLTAGTYSVSGRWRRTAGTGVLTRNNLNLATISIKEVNVY